MTDNTDVPYDDDGNDPRDDGLLPDGKAHQDVPSSDNDREITRSLSEMFGRAWIH